MTTLEFDAFTQFHHSRYLRYAHARLGDPAAAAVVVEEAFASLAHSWTEILSSPSPAAVAWRILRRAVERRPHDPSVRAAPSAFTSEHADAVLLHDGLEMPLAEAAHLMGIDGPTLRARLAAGRRLLRTRQQEPWRRGE